MKAERALRAALLAAALPCAAAAFEPGTEAEARYHALIQELRCLVCQNQSIADSNAELADDLRRQVAAQIDAGKSDREIVDYLTARYGDFVLYRPPVRGRTLLLWAGPFAVLLLAAGLVFVFIRRSRRVPAVATPDPAALERLLGKDRAP